MVLSRVLIRRLYRIQDSMDPKNKSWDDGDKMIGKGGASDFMEWAPDALC